MGVFKSTFADIVEQAKYYDEEEKELFKIECVWPEWTDYNKKYKDSVMEDAWQQSRAELIREGMALSPAELEEVVQRSFA